MTQMFVKLGRIEVNTQSLYHNLSIVEPIEVGCFNAMAKLLGRPEFAKKFLKDLHLYDVFIDQIFYVSLVNPIYLPIQ